jgi:H+/Cl- antiporter ClcA
MNPNPNTDASRQQKALRTPLPSQLLWCSLAIGIAGGLLATIYYLLLQGLLKIIWPWMLHTPLTSLSLTPHFAPKILLVTSIGGLIVGLLTRWLGSAGEIAAVVDNIHMEHGRIDMRQTPAMTATSLVSIAAGGSAGPEAPLVQIIGSFGSWMGERLKLTGPMVRTLTFCGMGSALGAFFGAPLGGALFALEIPHRRGIEYYEALLPAIVSSLVAFLLFRSIVGYEAVIFHVPTAGAVSVRHVFWGIGFGVLGAIVAALFAGIFTAIGTLMHRLHHRPVLLGTLGGITIGLLAQLCPLSLFWSELQMDSVLHSPITQASIHTTRTLVCLLLLLAGIKMVSISATLHSGFRGGFIFPLMFIGASIGTAITVAYPSIPAAVAVIGMMAAVNVAITKTPVSTSVLLVTLTGANITPVIIAACVTSLLLSSRLNLIHTQRPRAGSQSA